MKKDSNYQKSKRRCLIACLNRCAYELLRAFDRSGDPSFIDAAEFSESMKKLLIYEAQLEKEPNKPKRAVQNYSIN